MPLPSIRRLKQFSTFSTKPLCFMKVSDHVRLLPSGFYRPTHTETSSDYLLRFPSRISQLSKIAH